APVLVERGHVSAKLRIRQQSLSYCRNALAVSELFHPAGIGNGNAVQHRLAGLELIIKSVAHRKQARVQRVRRCNTRYQMSALVGDVGCRNVKVLRELTFDGKVPLLAIGEMTVVELPVGSGRFSVCVRQVKKRRRLIRLTLEALRQQCCRRDSTVRAVENHARVEPIASAADTGVPSRIAERLIEHPVSAANYGLGI